MHHGMKFFLRNGHLQIVSKICQFQDTEDLWAIEDYDREHVVTCISDCLEEDDTILELNLSINKIIRGREEKIIQAIKANQNLTDTGCFKIMKLLVRVQR